MIIHDERRKWLYKCYLYFVPFQPNAPRSKTVILVKNLPAKTAVADITSLFATYGTLGRVVLPPTGVTAIVEFIAPAEARTAFTRLAYTKVGADC